MGEGRHVRRSFWEEGARVRVAPGGTVASRRERKRKGQSTTRKWEWKKALHYKIKPI